MCPEIAVRRLAIPASGKEAREITFLRHQGTQVEGRVTQEDCVQIMGGVLLPRIMTVDVSQIRECTEFSARRLVDSEGEFIEKALGCNSDVDVATGVVELENSGLLRCVC
jgi:hypothetical protein